MELARSVTLVQPNVAAHWLIPAWSLTFEVYFYAWVIALVWLFRARPHLAVSAALACLVAWCFGWLWWDHVAVFKGLHPLRDGLTAFGIEFLLGALLSEGFDFLQRLEARPGAEVLTFCLVIAVAGYAMGITAGSYPVEMLRVASFGMGAMGLFAAFLALQLSGVRAPAPLVHLGDASFSLYLLHTFLIDGIGTYLPLSGNTPFLQVRSAAYVLLMGGLVVLVSLGWYRAVERPVLKWCLGRVSGRRPGTDRAPLPTPAVPARRAAARTDGASGAEIRAS